MLAYPSKVLVIADYDKVRFEEKLVLKFDFVLSCGNVAFPILEEIHELHKKPIFAVKGNYDSHKVFPEFVEDVHDRIVQHRHWLIGGWQGVPACRSAEANEGDGMSVTERLSKFPYVDIFICHAPIYKRADKADKEDDVHTGSEAILRYIREKQPKYVYHGHVYSKMGTTIDSSAVVGVFGAEIFRLD